MQSEVRKVLEAMREWKWGTYSSFFKKLDAAERADAAKREEAVRNAVAELIERWKTSRESMSGWTRIVVGQLLKELDAIISTKTDTVGDRQRVDSQPVTVSEPSVTFGVSPKLTLPAGAPADEHIRAIAEQAVRDAMPDVLNAVADAIHGCGFTAGVNGLRKHAAKLRKERGS